MRQAINRMRDRQERPGRPPCGYKPGDDKGWTPEEAAHCTKAARKRHGNRAIIGWLEGIRQLPRCGLIGQPLLQWASWSGTCPTRSPPAPFREQNVHRGERHDALRFATKIPSAVIRSKERNGEVGDKPSTSLANAASPPTHHRPEVRHDVCQALPSYVHRRRRCLIDGPSQRLGSVMLYQCASCAKQVKERRHCLYGEVVNLRQIAEEINCSGEACANGWPARRRRSTSARARSRGIGFCS